MTLSVSPAEELAQLARALGDPAHGHAILAEGNVSDALRQYRLVRELLRTQLGLEPSPTLQDLVAPLPAA